MRTHGLSAALCALALLAAGCRTAAVIDPAAIADAQIAARIKTALVNDPEVGVRAIEVIVTQGVARFSGRVQSRDEIETAVRLARMVPGVVRVEVALSVAADPNAETAPAAPSVAGGEPDLFETDTAPRLLAVGGSFGWSRPRNEALRARVSVGPLIRLGSGRGPGVAIGFDWFKADFGAADDQTRRLARLTVRPVMAGLSYTFAAERVSVSPGVVAGIAFNSLSITETGAAEGALAVEVDNSLVWRPGVSVWFDANRRLAINVTSGYVMTGLDLTLLEGGRLSKRHASGNTLLLRAGIAYKVF